MNLRKLTTRVKSSKIKSAFRTFGACDLLLGTFEAPWWEQNGEPCFNYHQHAIHRYLLLISCKKCQILAKLASMEESFHLYSQLGSNYEDEFNERAGLNGKAVLDFFDTFPFEEESASWNDQPIHTPYPTIFLRNEGKVSCRIQMQENGDFIIEFRKQNGFFEQVANRDFSENPRLEIRTLLAAFVEGKLESSIEWQEEEQTSAHESDTNAEPLHFEFDPTWQFWIKFPEAFIFILAFFVISIGLITKQGLPLIMGTLILAIPFYAHIKLWRLRNQVKGCSISILPKDHAFIWKKEGESKTIQRNDISKAKLILHKTRNNVWLELHLHLAHGGEIKMNSLLFDPMILLNTLKIKYQVG